MAQVPAIDISQWQGSINFAGVPQDIVIIKMSGGDNNLYYDTKGGANYYAAKAAGKAVAGYHFAGGTDPIAEAQQFLRAMSPLDTDDVMVLDWEVQHANPVEWCRQFVQFIHDQAGVWCLVYLNISTTNAYDWSPVLNNCGLYIAAPSYGWSDTIPVRYPVVMQQGPYTHVPGIGGGASNVDSDMWFGTIDQFKAYGYHAPNTPPAPDPKPPASSPSASVSSSVSSSPSSSASVSESASESSSVSPSPSASPEAPDTGGTLLDWVKNVIQIVVNFLTSWRKK